TLFRSGLQKQDFLLQLQECCSSQQNHLLAVHLYELIHHKLFQKRKHFSHFLRNKLMCLMGLSLNESEGSDVDHSILKGNRLFHLSYMLSSCILLLLTLVSIISYLSLLSSRISVI